jgi:hypothetical protein
MGGGGGSAVDYTVKLQPVEQDRANTYLMLEQIYREEPRSTSDVIDIIPQEHSPITQQLETWFQTMVSLSKSSYKSKEKTKSFEVRVLPFIEIERSIQ